jgi:hypothetical protein
MSRKKLKPRHLSETRTIEWSDAGGMVYKFIATYGLDDAMNVKEVFCASFKGHSGIVALANDACIAISRLLQHGTPILELAEGLSENRREGEDTGYPASPLGVLVKVGVDVEHAWKSTLLPPPSDASGSAAGAPNPTPPNHSGGGSEAAVDASV